MSHTLAATPLRDTLAMARLRFDPDEEREFEAAREVLLDEFSAWLRAHRGPADHGLDDDAQTFLDWRWGYSSGELDRFERDDLHEFLLEWCPRKLSAPPEAVLDIVRGVVGYIEFLASTDRLVGGAGAAAHLIVAAEDLAPDAVEAMSDPANFGMAKSLFGTALSDAVAGAESPEELQAALDRAMDEFNALPDHERRAATDRFASPAPARRELPFIHITPDPDEVALAADAAPVLGQFDRLRAALTAGRGDDGPGLVLTPDHEIVLDDARWLVATLDTGDVIDPMVDGRIIPTEASHELVGLMARIAWAEASGAIEVIDDRLVATDWWGDLPAVDRAAEVFEALVEIGALALRGPGPDVLADIDRLIDDGLLHWMMVMFPAGSTIPASQAVDVATEVCQQRIDPTITDELFTRLPTYVTRQVGIVLDALAATGLATWSGRERLGGSDAAPLWSGGELRLTALGRHLLPGQLDKIGYSVRTIDDPTTVSATDLLDLLIYADVDPDLVREQWWSDRPDEERARALVDAVVEAPDASRRIAGFSALARLDRDEIVGPMVRQLLDSPVSGHAAMFLLEHHLATEDEVGSFFDDGPMIDILATVVPDPETMAELFVQMGHHKGGPEALLQSMWRQPAAETAGVLETLGKHLPDKKLAKAARRALVQHRSWMADPNR